MIPAGSQSVAAAPCETLAWDTELFGFPVARVTVERLDDAQARRVLAWCEAQDVACLYFLAPCDDRQTLHAVEAHGFELVDVRVDMRLALADARGETDRTVRVRHAGPTDAAALSPIARSSFDTSRFFFDGRFPADRCAALYDTWLARSLAGELAEAVLVADAGDDAVGFVTCEVTGRTGRIGLLAVSARARGAGAGVALCRSALRWFAERGLDEVTVTTQARNAAALRLYERCGFETERMALWYHRWFEGRGR